MQVAFRPLAILPYFKQRDTFYIVIIINEYKKECFGKIYFHFAVVEED